MKAFKIIVLAFLGIFLSLSLLVFGLALMVNQSVLNPDFIADQVDSLDIAALTDEIIIEEIPPEAADFMGESLDEILTAVITDIEPWLKDQARNGIYVFYDYLEGRSQSLNLVISLETMMESFRSNLLNSILTSPPAELSGLSPAEIELQFNEHWSQIEEEVPAALELTETALDAEVMEQIEQAKQYVSYFNTAFIALIAFSLLMILLIILVYREVKGSCRQIGFTFLSIGVVSLAGAFVARSIANSALASSDIPATLQTWAPNVITDVLTPLGIYGIGLIVVGIAMAVVSFVYKRGEYSDYDYY